MSKSETGNNFRHKAIDTGFAMVMAGLGLMLAAAGYHFAGDALEFFSSLPPIGQAFVFGGCLFLLGGFLVIAALPHSSTMPTLPDPYKD